MQKTLQRAAAALLILAALIGWPAAIWTNAEPYQANACEIAGDCEQ